jgi:O-antigen ligase
VGILLTSGFVGLFLFLGFFATICLGVYGATKQIGDSTDERRLLGRALLATFIGILVSILTVSSISVIPTVYWCIAGVAVAYTRLASVEVRPVASALRETRAESPGKFARPTRASAGR